MRLLILGGTGFLGRHMTKEALSRGHAVTLFDRGTTAPNLFPGLDHRLGDRRGGLGPLAAERWDAVIDLCGHAPEVVRESALTLARAADSYSFVSSLSVYADLTAAHLDENSPTHRPTQLPDDSFGFRKAECERELARLWPRPLLVIRPCAMSGPYDSTGRLLWWLSRLARGGDVLAPGNPKRAVQIIDARDLAKWTVEMIESKGAGTFNATGPSRSLTMGALLDACQKVVGTEGRLVWVDDLFLLACEVEPWSELPFWVLDDRAHLGFGNVSSARALAAGLRRRDLAETLADTWEWACREHVPLPPGVGLDVRQEKAILEAWQRAIRRAPQRQ